MPDYLSYIKDLDCELTAAKSPKWNLADSGIKACLTKRQATRFVGGKECNAWGLRSLQSAIAAKYGVAEQCVFTTSSASTAYYILWHSLVRRAGPDRRRVLFELPLYPPLKEVPASFGLTSAYFKREGLDCNLDINSVLSKCSNDTIAVVLTNPHNPSGSFVGDETLAALASQLKKRGVILILDEVFRDLAIDPAHAQGFHRGALVEQGSTVILSSLSKAYGLGHLKTGWLLANPKVISRVRASWVLVENVGSSLLEGSARDIIRGVIDRLSDRTSIRERPDKNRKALLAWILKNPSIFQGEVPGSGCLYFPRVAGIRDTRKLAQTLRREQVFFVPGHWFKAPRRIRLAFGQEPRLIEALDRIAVHIRTMRGG